MSSVDLMTIKTCDVRADSHSAIFSVKADVHICTSFRNFSSAAIFVHLVFFLLHPEICVLGPAHLHAREVFPGFTIFLWRKGSVADHYVFFASILLKENSAATEKCVQNF